MYRFEEAVSLILALRTLEKHTIEKVLVDGADRASHREGSLMSHV